MPADGENTQESTAHLKSRIRALEEALNTGSGDNPYRDLFEASADAILLIDGETFTDCNMATVKMLGYASKEELLQTHPSQLSPEHQADGRLSFAKANEMMALALEKGSHRFEWLHKRADGEVFPVEVLLTAVPQGDRKILHTVWRDITERKQLEEELRQAQKMEAIGKLSGGIAHDFNNLLMAISGNAEMLEVGRDPKSGDYSFVQEILRASQRSAALIEQLLAYSRKQILQPSVIDLRLVFRELDQMLGRLLGEDIDIVLELDPRPLSVLVDKSQLEQVILNLATNARDAMPGGGTLTITTSRRGTGSADAQQAVLSVEDTGTGIDPKHLGNIFDPFFTTKGVGRGTGLGLSTAYGIIKQSHGEITVTSTKGKGTVFQVLLPLQAELAAGDGPAKDQDSVAVQGKESVLLVEDEPAILRLLEKVLSDQGYRVHTAGNGQEALDLAAQAGVRFDLLLTDVVMPVVGGPELANRLQAQDPDLSVVYVSGYTSSVLLRRGLLAGDVDLVPKPFSPGEILAKVREVLDRA